MATPTIVFNSSTGSDTAASGAGPSTALTGAGASYSTTTVTLDAGTDLTNVATDGSHVLYLVTSTGRKLFEITAKAGSGGATPTVTVGTAPTGTSSGLSWAIGGKRATFDHTNSRMLFTADAKANWSVKTETDQTVTSSAISLNSTPTAAAPVIVYGDSVSTPRTVSQSANATTFQQAGSGWVFQNLKFTNTNGTKTSAVAIDGQGHLVRCQNCVFGDGTNHCDIWILSTNGDLMLFDCYFTGQRSGTTKGQVDIANVINKSCTMVGCYFKAAVGNCVRTVSTPYSTFEECVFDAPTGTALLFSNPGSGYLTVKNCTFNGGSTDGLDTSAGTLNGLTFVNNSVSNFTGTSKAGVRGSSAQSLIGCLIDFNNYYNCTNLRVNFPTGSNDLNVDPGYTNSSGQDFGVGTNLRAKGYPAGASRTLGANQSSTGIYRDIGAGQHQDSGGGGSSGGYVIGG